MANDKDAELRKKVEEEIDSVMAALDSCLPKPDGFKFFVEKDPQTVCDHFDAFVDPSASKDDIPDALPGDFAELLKTMKVLLDKKNDPKVLDKIKAKDKTAVAGLLKLAIIARDTKRTGRAASVSAPHLNADQVKDITHLRDVILKELIELNKEEIALVREITKIESKELKWLEKIQVSHDDGGAEKVHVSEVVEAIKRAGIREEDIRNEPDDVLKFIKYFAVTLIHLHEQTDRLNGILSELDKIFDEEKENLEETLAPKKGTDGEKVKADLVKCADSKAEAIEREFEELKLMFGYTQKLRLYLSQLESAEHLAEAKKDEGWHLVLQPHSQGYSNPPKVLVAEHEPDGNVRKVRATEGSVDINLSLIGAHLEKVTFGSEDVENIDVFFHDGRLSPIQAGVQLKKDCMELVSQDHDHGTYVYRESEKTVFIIVPEHFNQKHAEKLFAAKETGSLYDSSLKVTDVKIRYVVRLPLQEGDLFEPGNSGHYIFKLEKRGNAPKLKKKGIVEHSPHDPVEKILVLVKDKKFDEAAKEAQALNLHKEVFDRLRNNKEFKLAYWFAKASGLEDSVIERLVIEAVKHYFSTDDFASAAELTNDHGSTEGFLRSLSAAKDYLKFARFSKAALPQDKSHSNISWAISAAEKSDQFVLAAQICDLLPDHIAACVDYLILDKDGEAKKLVKANKLKYEDVIARQKENWFVEAVQLGIGFHHISDEKELLSRIAKLFGKKSEDDLIDEVVKLCRKNKYNDARANLKDNDFIGKVVTKLTALPDGKLTAARLLIGVNGFESHGRDLFYDYIYAKMDEGQFRVAADIANEISNLGLRVFCFAVLIRLGQVNLNDGKAVARNYASKIGKSLPDAADGLLNSISGEDWFRRFSDAFHKKKIFDKDEDLFNLVRQMFDVVSGSHMAP
jgi:hypothetical protein